MKVTEFAEVIASIAKNHPFADIAIGYPSRHAGRATTKRGRVTGYRVSVPSHAAIRPTLWIEVEHARSENAEASDE